MRVLLVNPSQEPDINTNLPRFVDEHRGHLPPLGLLYIATCAKQAGHDVKVIDTNIDDSLGDTISNFQPEVVGITATTFTLLQALKIAEKAKDCRNIKVVLGGVHASIYPEETIGLDNVDYVVSGEGENAFLELLSNIERSTPVKTVRSKGHLEVLDALPFPDRTFTDYTKYESILGSKGYITTMITSRGCPYKCIFCHRPHMGKQFRARSPKNVLNEMRQIKEMGISEVMVYDDTFTVDRERVVKICKGMIQEKLGLTWDIRARVDTVDIELLRILKLAGCKRIHFGIEASSPKILENLGKQITLEQARQAIKNCKNVGIETLAYFIIGSPGETIEDILHTIEFAKKLNPDYCHFAIMTPYPATPLYQLWLNKGKLDHWAEFAKKPYGIQTPYWDELKAGILEELLTKAYQSFYLRPSFVAKRLLKVRNMHNLLDKAKVALSIIKQ